MKSENEPPKHRHNTRKTSLHHSTLAVSPMCVTPCNTTAPPPPRILAVNEHPQQLHVPQVGGKSGPLDATINECSEDFAVPVSSQDNITPIVVSDSPPQSAIVDTILPVCSSTPDEHGVPTPTSVTSTEVTPTTCSSSFLNDNTSVPVLPHDTLTELQVNTSGPCAMSTTNDFLAEPQQNTGSHTSISGSPTSSCTTVSQPRRTKSKVEEDVQVCLDIAVGLCEASSARIHKERSVSGVTQPKASKIPKTSKTTPSSQTDAPTVIALGSTSHTPQSASSAPVSLSQALTERQNQGGNARIAMTAMQKLLWKHKQEKQEMEKKHQADIDHLKEECWKEKEAAVTFNQSSSNVSLCTLSPSKQVKVLPSGTWEDYCGRSAREKEERTHLLEHCTYVKLHMNLSHSEWHLLCSLLHIPERKKAILQCMKQHCSWAQVSPMRNGFNGAYASCYAVFQSLVERATKQHLWDLHGLNHILVKGFIDGRQLWGKNLFYGMSLASVTQTDRQVQENTCGRRTGIHLTSTPTTLLPLHTPLYLTSVLCATAVLLYPHPCALA
ncbi:hypothetical protein Pelo_5276 [Pelomyxa schiedti]|nr:hypothetical protein Pelo_5276 [Pelomyxa schiedti]